MKRLKTALFYLLFGPLIGAALTAIVEVTQIFLSGVREDEIWMMFVFFLAFGYPFGATPAAISGWIIRDIEIRQGCVRAKRLSFIVGFFISLLFFMLVSIVSNFGSISDIFQLQLVSPLIQMGLVGGVSAYILTIIRDKLIIRNELQ